MLNEGSRRVVAAAAPRAFNVLDWPTLRAEFTALDRLANQAKRSINRHGAASATLGAVGASILALDPLVSAPMPRSVVAVLGCVAVLVGALMGLWHLLLHDGRGRWLVSRMRTERLRQFHFQYVLSHFDDAVAAMAGGDPLDHYRTRRDGALAAYLDEFGKQVDARGFAGATRWLADDHEDARAWIVSDWRHKHVAPGAEMTADRRELLECLSRGRIGIQEIYAELNLKPGAANQKGLARRVAFGANMSTLVFVVSLALAGVWIVLNRGDGGFAADALTAVSGVAAAWGLCFRLFDQGMGYSLDTERYELYAGQVALVRQRFDHADEDVRGRIDALRQLELYAYREMRQFLHVHLGSRFLG